MGNTFYIYSIHILHILVCFDHELSYNPFCYSTEIVQEGDSFFFDEAIYQFMEILLFTQM